jgi:urease accessory protein
MTDNLDSRGLLKLMTWLSPSFPVGAYAYSHGIEYAVETGSIGTAQELTDWVGTILSDGSGRIDADLFCAAHQACVSGDDQALNEDLELALAMRGTSETALESSAQGKAFNTTRAQLAGGPPEKNDVPYAIAVAIAGAQEKLALRPALTAFLHAVVSNLVSAGVRLVPLGQTDGQRCILALEQTILEAIDFALRRQTENQDVDLIDYIGAAAPMVDWTSMKHQTQYTRLFRS